MKELKRRTIHRPRSKGSDDEGSDGSDVEGGGVPAAADTAAVADATLPTPLQQFLVDEFANTDGEIRNTAILHFYDWGHN